VGLGVHGGQKVELTFRPAPVDSGIVFRRVDLPQPVNIAVAPETVSDTRMATTISPGGDPGGPKVQTIEHLLSACAGLGLDNIVIDISGEEVPVLDGSAASSTCCKAPASSCRTHRSALSASRRRSRSAKVRARR
jgi:UDP-3-O-[3-hydroxymyristoyl] N-acetylglucosamine deacetylase